MFCVIRKIVFIFAAGNDKSHITMSEINQTINLHVSVDCVLIGFDGEQFRVLLVRQVGKQSEDGYNNMKLPGSLIYDDEDLDEAAKRVLNELTGLKNVKLTQFKAYGSKNRTRNPKDVLWLERFHRLDEKKIDRIVTIAYLTLVKIDRRFEQLSDKYDACWTPVTEVKAWRSTISRFCRMHWCIYAIMWNMLLPQCSTCFPGSLRRPSCGLSIS